MKLKPLAVEVFEQDKDYRNVTNANIAEMTAELVAVHQVLNQCDKVLLTAMGMGMTMGMGVDRSGNSLLQARPLWTLRGACLVIASDRGRW